MTDRMDTIKEAHRNVTIGAMFSRLVKTYSPAEAKDILLAKYSTLTKVQLDSIELKTKEIKMSKVTTKNETTAKAKSTTAKAKSTTAKAKSTTAEAASKPKAKKVAVPKTKKVTKAMKALELFNGSKDQTRSVMLDMFVSELSVTKGNAAIYYWKITTGKIS